LSWRLKPCSESESVMFAGRLSSSSGVQGRTAAANALFWCI